MAKFCSTIVLQWEDHQLSAEIFDFQVWSWWWSSMIIPLLKNFTFSLPLWVEGTKKRRIVSGAWAKMCSHKKLHHKLSSKWYSGARQKKANTLTALGFFFQKTMSCTPPPLDRLGLFEFLLREEKLRQFDWAGNILQHCGPHMKYWDQLEVQSPDVFFRIKEIPPHTRSQRTIFFGGLAEGEGGSLWGL